MSKYLLSIVENLVLTHFPVELTVVLVEASSIRVSKKKRLYNSEKFNRVTTTKTEDKIKDFKGDLKRNFPIFKEIWSKTTKFFLKNKEN